MAFIGIDREIENHWIYQDAEYFKVWFEILLRARYSNEPEKTMLEGKLVVVERGQFIFGRISWSKRLGVSEQRLRTLFKKLVTDGMVDLVQKFPKFSLYRVKNYEKYNQQNNQQQHLMHQGVSDTTNQQINNGSTSSQPAANQQLTTQEQGSNKVNKDNKVNKKEYVDYVFLTETEYNKLNELFSPEELSSYFLRFSSWISGQTKRVQQSRSAYLTILNWHREDQKKVKQFKPNSNSSYLNTKNRLQQILDEEEAKKRGKNGYCQTGTDPFS